MKYVHVRRRFENKSGYDVFIIFADTNIIKYYCAYTTISSFNLIYFNDLSSIV